MSETQFYLSIQGRNIPLNYNTQLTQTDIPQLQPQGYDGVVAQINPNPQNPAILGLKNCSTQIWTVTLPTKEIIQIPLGKSIKLEENTQINFGLIYGNIAQKTPEKNVKKFPKKPLIIVGIISLIVTVPLLIYSLFFNKNLSNSANKFSLNDNSNCNGLVSRRKKLGIANWDEVNQRFWQQTDYPYGKNLDPNYPNFDNYQKQWCQIANQWLSEKE